MYLKAKKIAKNLSYWTLPQGIEEVARSLLWLIDSPAKLSLEEQQILSRNSKFRNMYAGRRCFVIGNGPSLNKHDLGLLSNEITITMNKFYLHPILEKWQPTFHCFSDSLICPDDRPEKLNELLGFANKIVSNIHPQAFFFSLFAKQLLEENKIAIPEKSYYLKPILAPSIFPVEKHLELTQSLPAGMMTSHLAIAIALYLGCSPIYLIGYDHDWLAQRSIVPHFYEKNKNNLSSTDDFTQFKYKNLMQWYLVSWELYEAFEKVAKIRGTTIFNATPNSFLDVFPRIEFNTLFE
jgi:hypothetical protein